VFSFHCDDGGFFASELFKDPLFFGCLPLVFHPCGCSPTSFDHGRMPRDHDPLFNRFFTSPWAASGVPGMFSFFLCIRQRQMESPPLVVNSDLFSCCVDFPTASMFLTTFEWCLIKEPPPPAPHCACTFFFSRSSFPNMFYKKRN